MKSKAKFRMKSAAVFTFLVALSVVSSIPAKAQGTGVAKYERQSAEAAKKQQKISKKAAKKQRKMSRKADKKQRKAMKKYEKSQRKATKKANHRAS
jgi:butyrate kinase